MHPMIPHSRPMRSSCHATPKLKRNAGIFLIVAVLALVSGVRTCPGADSEITRKSLSDIRGVYVLVEELQPNLQKYNKRTELSATDLRRRVEAQLREAGIKVYDRDEWFRTSGNPMLYINVNTHEYEKYHFAYDIRIELQQIAYPAINPAMKLLVTTWSSNMTGVVNPGTITTIAEGVRAGAALFINAYLAGRR
jgi:hypothetical protein